MILRDSLDVLDSDGASVLFTTPAHVGYRTIAGAYDRDFGRVVFEENLEAIVPPSAAVDMEFRRFRWRGKTYEADGPQWFGAEEAETIT